MNRKKSKAFVPTTSLAPPAVAVIVAEPEALARELGREAAAQVGVLGPVLHEQLLERVCSNNIFDINKISILNSF